VEQENARREGSWGYEAEWPENKGRLGCSVGKVINLKI
jgi:hypothetical protein